MIAKTVSVPVAASRRPPIAGPAKTPTLSIVVRTRFAAVSSSGDLASSGQQCGLGRAKGRLEQPHQSGQRVDHARGGARERGERRAGDGDAPCDVDRDDHALPGKTVPEQGAERSGDERRQHPEEPDQPYGARAASLVGVEREGDDEDPVGADRPCPGELHPPQIRVGEDRGEGFARLGQPLLESLQHRPMVEGLCLLREEREDVGLFTRLVLEIVGSIRR